MSTHYQKGMKQMMSSFQVVPEGRAASYDFCYGYFQAHCHELSKNIELSCLHLWSYLASWGMLRGSGKLISNCSMKVLTDVIMYLDSLHDSDWILDVDDYSDEDKRDRIIEIYNDLSSKIRSIKVDGALVGVNATITLVTKIMLGTIGCVPAFDDFFSSTFRSEFATDKPHCGFRILNSNALLHIHTFYLENKEALKDVMIPVIDFNGNPMPGLFYKKAKLIDMFGWNVGLENSLK
ncbi:MAG: hypothetical protein IJS05_02500 [Paludibacteraceae bacterium]|nr:hypothetical protein [Paludibacteraceae bacterium]